MSQWQKIESAPKDGSSIMLWEKYSENHFVGYWGSGEWRACKEHVSAEGGWDGANVIDYVQQEFVTHWMPCPESPIYE